MRKMQVYLCIYVFVYLRVCVFLYLYYDEKNEAMIDLLIIV